MLGPIGLGARRREVACALMTVVIVLAADAGRAAQSAAAGFVPAQNACTSDVEHGGSVYHGGGRVITHYAFCADGSTTYAVGNYGPPEAPWEIVVMRRGTFMPKPLTENARNEFAVVPSPDGAVLLVLAEIDGSLDLMATGRTAASGLVHHRPGVQPGRQPALRLRLRQRPLLDRAAGARVARRAASGGARSACRGGCGRSRRARSG
jgi:hypothetical protein